MASSDGSVTHRELWHAIQRATGQQARPVFLPASLTSVPVGVKTAWGMATGRMPYERLWMLKYIDRPWTVDATYTRTKLGWGCTPGMGIRDRLPMLLDRFSQDRYKWERRNCSRNEGLYAYAPDDS